MSKMRSAVDAVSRPAVCVLATCVVLWSGLTTAAPPAKPVRVTLDAGRTHQTILGWSVNPSAMWLSTWQRDGVLELAVNDLGLTRCRAQAPNGNRAAQRRWEWDNDNGDPYQTDYRRYNIAAADPYIEMWLKPFKRLVEARGEPFNLWVSPSFFTGGSSGDAPAWLLESPAEYAEFATSYLLHLKNKHGIEADYQVICNEPANNNAFRPPVVARMIRTLGPRLAELGLRTQIEFPDGVNARSAWQFIQHVGDDPRVWRYVGVLSYHLYGTTEPFRTQIRDLAIAKGIPSAQSEQMGSKFDRMYDDLTNGGVSYWSVYGWGNVIEIAHDGVSFLPGRDYWRLRQITHYVRPGAVRIRAGSDEPSLRALAFTHKNGTTVVLLNTARGAAQRTVTVGPLPAGRYGVCHAVGARPGHERGVQTVGEGGTLTLPVGRNVVVTIYPYAGANQTPTITEAIAAPPFLTRPRSEVTLSAEAMDTEGDAVSFAWSVASQPAGAAAMLTTPAAGRTKASGLSVPGQYAFVVTASDGTKTVRREVRVTVFADNQPPKFHDVHNRIPVRVTLPHSQTHLRAWPVDIEGDKLTTRWTVVRTPSGAEVTLGPEPKDKSGNGRLATGLTVAGEYVFRFSASDGHSESHADLTVPVFPVNGRPVVTEASAGAVADGATTLAAKATDPDGDTLTCWWSVKKAPRGAAVLFDKPGLATTEVRGLGEPGEYIFVVRAIDATAVGAREVNVTVGR